MPTTTSLVEVMVVAHLQAPMNLTVLDMASWAETFNQDYPLVQQTPPIPPFSINPNNIAFQFGAPLALPRLVLRSSSTPFVVQFQMDRFGLSWARKDEVGEPAEYCSYGNLRGLWSKEYKRFADWFQSRFGGLEPRIGATELLYNNAVPHVRADGSHRRISEVFSFVTAGGRGVNAFNASWTELLRLNDDNAPRVNAQTGLGMVGPTMQHAFLYSFSGLSLIDPPNDEASFLTALDALHERINEMHKATIVG